MRSTARLPRTGTGSLQANLAAAVALAVLLGAGGYLRYAKSHGQLYILKKPVPLARALSELRPDTVAPYVVRDSERMSDEVEAELGTKTYLYWNMEDPSARLEKWNRTAALFITYYTGVQDQVPHVPEECYLQGGASPESEGSFEFTLPFDGRSYPVRRFAFVSPRAEGGRTFVYYTFIVNGDLYDTRNQVRARMMWTSEQHLYYTKIELTFSSVAGREPAPEMDRLAERLLGRVVSVMLREHLRDVKALETRRAAAPQAAGV